jgi:hypothetical protein
MPKIRIKNSGPENKSGILSSANKKFQKENFVDYKPENFNSVNPSVNISPFDDKKTIDFLVGTNDSTLPKAIDSKNYISTPSTHDDITVNRIPSKVQDNYLIGEVNNEFTRNSSFRETSLKGNENEKKSKLKIDIDLAGKDGYFQFAKNLDTEQNVQIGGETILARNSNVGYWDFSLKQWVYLGDINKNYFNIGADILEAPIAFTSLTSSSNNSGMNISTTGGDPTTTFGFPFDVKFQPLDSSKLDMSNYISQDFVLDSVRVSFDIDYLGNRSDYTQLQYLNFFILNNREFENNSIPDEVYDDASIYFIDADPKTSGDILYYSFKRDWSLIDTTGDIRKFSIYDGDTGAISTTGIPVENSENRDLVFYNKILLANIGTTQDHSYNLQNAVVDSDFYTGLQSSGVNRVSGKIEIKTDTNIGVTYRDKKDKMAQAEIYPTCYNHGRGYLNRQTSRSKNFGAEHYPADVISVNENDSYKPVSHLSSTRKSASYVLKSSDKLTFGVSFSPNMSFEQGSGLDLVKILGGMSITLYGSYESNNEPFVKTNIVDIHDNIKRDIEFNGDNSDELNESLIHSKTLYFNRREIASISLGGYSISIIGQKETGLLGSSINCVESFHKEVLIDEPDKKNKLFYHTRRFGHFSDYIKSSPWQVHEEKNPKYNVYRRWFSGFKQYDPFSTDKSWNIDSYSRITDGAYKE